MCWTCGLQHLSQPSGAACPRIRPSGIRGTSLGLLKCTVEIRLGRARGGASRSRYNPQSESGRDIARSCAHCGRPGSPWRFALGILARVLGSAGCRARPARVLRLSGSGARLGGLCVLALVALLELLRRLTLRDRLRTLITRLDAFRGTCLRVPRTDHSSH